MAYQNFGAAIYCPVENLIDIDNLEAFGEKFASIEKHIRVSKVYLETYRSGKFISEEKMKALKEFFKNRGIQTSGGITTDSPNPEIGGFSSLCYSREQDRELLTRVVAFTAGLFDEIILDDFFFTNCKCEACITAKGERSWSDFRVDLMREVSENIIIGTARKVNPKVSMIIKYPNWYEHYQCTGYNLKDQPEIFDRIYTGTETRNPTYTQQHLPKYQSYFIMRYLENVAPGRNGGGWYDPYECTYNLTSYADQAYLTLFSKPKEITMFCLGSLLEEDFSLCVPIAGQLYLDMDRHLSQLGNPVGTACYIPYHSRGEDYLHSYIGMLGIPLEPFPEYPANSTKIFLTESAAYDKDIIRKVRESLMRGADVIVTSGFVKATQEAFTELAEVYQTQRKALVNQFAYSTNGGVNYDGFEFSDKHIQITQTEFSTNDTWAILGGFGEDNNFTLLSKINYGKGRLYILGIPDDMGDLYHYPPKVLKCIREVFAVGPVTLEGAAKHTLYTYDNDTFVLRSFLPYYDHVGLVIAGENVVLENLGTGKMEVGVTVNGNTLFKQISAPGVNRIYKILRS